MTADIDHPGRPGSDPRPRVLVADDQADVRRALVLLLKDHGWESVEVAAPEAAVAAVRDQRFDAVLLDLNYARDTTSGREGLGILPRLLALEPDLAVIVMTAWGSVELAVECMRLGARDFVQKPWENERLLSILRTQRELGGALARGRRLEQANRLLSEAGDARLLTEAECMRKVLEVVERVGPSDASVLITGEHGTGKGLVARLLHETSRRASRPFVTLDGGGVPQGTFDSELFGHVRGAFTDAREDRPGRFEVADGGTLFLDEIANVPASMQPKLLRVIETGELERVGSSRTQTVDVRLVSATNADMDAETAEGRFRADLLYRLNTVTIHLPPLRERSGDVLLLARHFLARHAARYGRSFAGFTQLAERALLRHGWPGNVRELDHAVERSVLLGREERVTEADLGLDAASRPAAVDLEALTLEEAEAELLRRALQRHGGNVQDAARALGLSRSSAYRRLEKHGLVDRRGGTS